jgi:WD40 repeat protein
MGRVNVGGGKKPTGTATAADVLTGKTYSNSSGVGIVGTMMDHPAGDYATDAITYSGSTLKLSVPDHGFYNDGANITYTDADWAEANIKYNVNLFGKTGTFTSDATATAADIVTGKTAYSKGSKITGTYSMVNPAIVGQGSLTGKCLTALASGDLVTMRRHFGFDTLVNIASPASIPSANVMDAAYSSDGVYLATVNNGISPVEVYKQSGDTFTKLSAPSSVVTQTTYGVDFSKDTIYLATAINTTPYIAVYKRSGDTFSKLANPTTLPLYSATGISFSPDGIHVAIVDSSGTATIYKRSGDTFAKITSLTLPGYAASVEYSYDGVYLAVGHQNSPFITIYKCSGDTFTKLANPATLPGYTVDGVSFSPDGVYLSTVSYSGSIPLSIYKRSGDTFTKLANPASLPYTPNNCAFSSDGIYLSMVSNASPYFYTYKRSGDTFTKLANPSVGLPGASGVVEYNPLQAYLVAGGTVSPYLRFYKADILGDYAYKYAGLSDLGVPNYLGFGFMKAAGAANAAANVVTIPID